MLKKQDDKPESLGELCKNAAHGVLRMSATPRITH